MMEFGSREHRAELGRMEASARRAQERAQERAEALLLERRQVLAGAEMAALCALIARRGLPSPYGGAGYDGGPDERSAVAFEDAAVALMEKADALEAQHTEVMS